MDIKKWLWTKVGPTHEPRWLYLVIAVIAFAVVKEIVRTW